MSNSIHIQDSYKIVRPSEIYSISKRIVEETDVMSIKRRGAASVSIEWMAHNALYYIGYKREQTASVDIDDEPLWRRFLYTLISIPYWCLWWTIKLK